MQGLTLLIEAERAGLTITSERGGILIRGPQRSRSFARGLIDEKPAVIAALRAYTEDERRLLSSCPPRAHELVDLAKRVFARWDPVEVVNVESTR